MNDANGMRLRSNGGKMAAVVFFFFLNALNPISFLEYVSNFFVILAIYVRSHLKFVSFCDRIDLPCTPAIRIVFDADRFVAS